MPADESPNAVILPVGGFGDFGRGRALLPAQEVPDDRLLGVGAGFRFWPDKFIAGALRDALLSGGGFRWFLGSGPSGLFAGARSLRWGGSGLGGFRCRGNRRFGRHDAFSL